MPPTFKKPLEYDPSMANRTLAANYENSAEALTSKKKNMLVELGLADEALALDDDEEDDDDDMESPILTNGRGGGAAGASAGGASAPLPNYGYKDVFGKEYERRRRQHIELNGYDRYLSELLARAAESLQTLRADRGLQSPGSAEVISELQHELGALQGENRALRTQDASVLAAAPGLYSNGGAAAPASSGPPSHQAAAAMRRMEGELEQLGEENDRLRSLLQGTAEDDARQAQDDVRQLQAQALDMQLTLDDKDALIKRLQASGGKAGASPASGADTAATSARVAELQAELGQRDKRLSAALGEVARLGEMAATAAGGDTDRQLQVVGRDRDAHQARAEELEGQLGELDAQVAQLQETLRKREAHFEAKLSQMAAASDDQQQAATLQQQLWTLQEQSEQQVAEYEARVAEQGGLITQLQASGADAQATVSRLTSRMEQAKTEAASDMNGKLAGVYTQLDALQALRQNLMEELLAMQKEVFNDAMLTQMGRLVRDREISAVMKLRGENKVQMDAAQAASEESALQVGFIRAQAAEDLRIATLESQGQVKHYAEKWRAEFDRRKKLHNIVSELKGNIRVLCRVRPLVEREKAGAGGAAGDDLPVRALDEETLRVTGDKSEKDFEFDRVFGVDTGQDKIYEEVSGLVTSVLDGYNVCIMAYGQTGSGKTFTMEGPESNPGVYHRALTDLFRMSADRSDQMDYVFMASTLEIYNENIYDLLSSTKEADDKLDVKQGPEGMHVPGLRQEQVRCIEEVAAVIGRGKQNRSTFSTNMNEHSSRSHLVLSVHLTATTKATGVSLRGKLHLVDLAGSERLSRTGAQGDRLKEAQAINKSLSALGDVIQALQQRNSHIPYRNSKLTRLLEDSLGGNSKTVMVVHVSPAAENVSESKCSLEFASRARKVELGKAKQNLDGGGGGGSGTASPSAGSQTGLSTPVSRLAMGDAAKSGPGSRAGSPADSVTSNSSTKTGGNIAGLRKPAGR